MTRRRLILILATAACGSAAAWGVVAASADGAAPVVRVTVLDTFPHDRTAFTQGLAWEDGTLFESTGRRGTSVLRAVDVETGRVLRQSVLANRYFGEGIAVLGDRVYQLTWQSKAGFIYDRETFRPLGRFRLGGEGWGIASDGDRLVYSDGTDNLRFLDPGTLRVTGRIRVRDGRRPVTRLNELEWVPVPGDPHGEILANVWYSPLIARIDPATGTVRGWLDCRELIRQSGVTDREQVLNGIAHVPAIDHRPARLLLTGKFWPTLFAVRWPPE